MTPRRRVLPLFVPHLGCPHLCVFCNQNTISGTDYSATKDNICHILENTKMNAYDQPLELAFYGGSFTAVPASVQRELLECVQPYRKAGLIGDIRCSTRPDAVSEEILTMLKEYGVRTIELGCQSMDPDVLSMSGRGHTPEDVCRAAELIHDAGMDLIVQMMTGLPGDSDEKSINTAVELVNLHPEGARIYPTVIIRDTKLFDMWNEGEYKEHTVEDAVRVGSRIIPIFQHAGVPVIRFGLNPTEELSNGEAVAGAYHPALGELVYSRIMLNNARNAIGSSCQGKDAVLRVGKGRTSKMAGQHRDNLKTLQKEFLLNSIKIREDDGIVDDSVLIDFIAK